MQKIDIKDVDFHCAKYHFSSFNNYRNISLNGLLAQKGSASRIVHEPFDRVYVSSGIKGLLGIKNAFIFKFINFAICDIPNDYRPFFDIKDFKSKERLTKKQVYDAMIRKFQTEIYFIVDAKEGEDYLKGEIKGYDIKCKKNHNINPQKLKLLVIGDKCSALSILQYYYRIYINEFGDKDYCARYMNASLSSFLDYYKTGAMNEYNLDYYIEKNAIYKNKLMQKKKIMIK